MTGNLDRPNGILLADHRIDLAQRFRAICKPEGFPCTQEGFLAWLIHVNPDLEFILRGTLEHLRDTENK